MWGGAWGETRNSTEPQKCIGADPSKGGPSPPSPPPPLSLTLPHLQGLDLFRLGQILHIRVVQLCPHALDAVCGQDQKGVQLSGCAYTFMQVSVRGGTL